MKKTILIIISLLIVGDITLIISAHAQERDVERDLQQLRQLQQADQKQQQQSEQVPVPVVRPAEPTKAETLTQRLQRSQQAAPVPTQQPVAAAAPQTVSPPPTQPQAQTPQPSAVGLTAKAIDERAFQQTLKSMMPLTAEQMMRLRTKHNNIERSKLAMPSAPPKPVTSTQMVKLATGATPPVVRLFKGYVSSLVFLDSTGAPWPIQDYDLGDPTSFNIQWDKKGNTLMVQATKLYSYGNIAIRLQGLATPIMMTLIPGQQVVDYRADLHVLGYGPNARVLPVTQEQPDNIDDVLLSALDGVPPAASHALTAKGGDAQVWLRGEEMFVRTRLKVLSPGWLNYVSSADGMNVYKMQKSPSLLVALPQQGKTATIKITGW